MAAPSSLSQSASPVCDPAGGDLRRPEVFFAHTWRGSGVASDAFGIPRDRYEVSFGPLPTPDGSSREGGLVVDHRIVFEHGVTNAYEWALLPARGDAISARDLKSGALAKGWINHDGFQWAFNGRSRTPFGVQTRRHEVVITLVSPIEISAAVTVCFLGVTVGASASHLRRAD